MKNKHIGFFHDSCSSMAAFDTGCHNLTCKKQNCCDSHVIPQKLLRRISKNNKVYTSSYHYGEFITKKERPELQVVSKATIRKLFCKECDNDIFEPIETSPFDISKNKHIFLLYYRAVVADYHMEHAINETDKSYCENLRKTNAHSFADKVQKDSQRYSSLKTDYELVQKDYINNNHDDYAAFYLELSTVPDLMVCSTITGPHNIFFEKQPISIGIIHYVLATYYSEITKKWYLLFIFHERNIIPINHIFRKIEDGFQNHSEPIGLLIANQIFAQANYWACSPAWWEKQQPAQKEYASFLIHRTTPNELYPPLTVFPTINWNITKSGYTESRNAPESILKKLNVQHFFLS